MVTDCGSYDLTLRYDNGTKREIHGSLIGDATVEHDGVPVSLTNLMRRMVPVEQLFAFDGDMTDDYAGYAEILEFSEVWEAKFHSDKFPMKEFQESFGMECAALGFYRGELKEVEEWLTWPEALPPKTFNEIVGEVDSVDALGSALYTKWDSLLKAPNCYVHDSDIMNWFATILRRIKEIATQKLQ